MKLIITISLMSCLLMSGCWGYRNPKAQPIVRTAPSPALIGHIVLIELENPEDVRRVSMSADAMLGTIPSVASYSAGVHLDTGRSTVSKDYDLAIYLGFASRDDLAAYVEHEQHIKFVEDWKPKLKSLRVYDMINDHPYPNILHCIRQKKFLGIF